MYISLTNAGEGLGKDCRHGITFAAIGGGVPSPALFGEDVVGRGVVEDCAVSEVGADVVLIRGDGDMEAAFPAAGDDEFVVVVVMSAFAVV